MIEGMHDSGDRQSFETGAVRDSGDGKTRPDLISPYANEREGEWMRKGSEKYTERNWEKGIPISRCIASLERHLCAYKRGCTAEDHMAAIRTNASFILHYEEMIKRGLLPSSLDDMPKYEQGQEVALDYTPDDPGLIESAFLPALGLAITQAADFSFPDGIVTRGLKVGQPRCYLAGPMRGYPNYNFPAFIEAAHYLRVNGWEVLSPADIEMADGLDPINHPEAAEERVANFTAEDWRQVIMRDLACVLALDPQKDAVFVLPGWEGSTGAVAEVMVARWRGLRIFSTETGVPIERVDGATMINRIRQDILA